MNDVRKFLSPANTMGKITNKGKHNKTGKKENKEPKLTQRNRPHP